MKLQLNKQIIPALIVKTQKELYFGIDKIKEASKLIHLDIANNTFVQNNSIDFDFSLNHFQELEFEAHLMINNPSEWIEKNWDKVNTIIVHVETCNRKELESIIRFARTRNKKIGIAISPETSVNYVKQYMNLIDQLLIVTVNPGFYGSKFIPSTINKINYTRSINPDLNVEADGGITPETIKLIHDSGANMLVSGSYIMKSDNIKKAINSLRTAIK